MRPILPFMVMFGLWAMSRFFLFFLSLGYSFASTASGVLSITSNHLMLKPESREALFYGNVQAFYQNVEVLADQLLITFDQKQQPYQIEAFGRIEITADDKKARGDYAIYQKASKLLNLYGSVNMKQDGLEMTGSQFQYNINSGKASLKQSDHNVRTKQREAYVKQWKDRALSELQEATNLLDKYGTSEQ